MGNIDHYDCPACGKHVTIRELDDGTGRAEILHDQPVCQDFVRVLETAAGISDDLLEQEALAHSLSVNTKGRNREKN